MGGKLVAAGSESVNASSGKKPTPPGERNRNQIPASSKSIST
jgi:hypothetical protein